ncbi:MAG: hypothetical protein ACE1ZW_06660, partial [Nitrospirales bacterium]
VLRVGTAISPEITPSLVQFFRAPLKTVLFRDGGVSRVLTSSCIRPYTPVFRARLPCPHKKCLVFRGALYSYSSFHKFFIFSERLKSVFYLKKIICQFKEFGDIFRAITALPYQ